MSRFAELHVRSAKDGEDLSLCAAQVTQKELTAARQAELYTRVDCADAVQVQWRLRYLQDVAVACWRELFSQRFVYCEFGDVHVFEDL